MQRLAGALGIVAIVVLVVTAQSAGAQELPTVRIAGTTGMSETQQCFTEPTFTPGSFTLERSGATGTLAVTFHIAGGPTDLNSDPAAGADGTATFADGQTQVTVTVNPALGGSEASVAIVDGAAYNLADPSSATIAKSVSAVQCAPEGPPQTTAPATRSQNLARTGSPSFTFGLGLIGLGMIVCGMAMKRVADSRIR
ncbi:MAG TPA: hypothetical protein VHI95_05155 [Acidimicrobiales bacterium]|jgi:hypothetical protein|nr:hypothetical protein [Acidimicrobiales bacterium]